MKKISLYIAVLVVSNIVFAQQLPQSSMYMMNNYLLNPAEGGTEDFIDLQAGYRTQWTGISGDVGPKTIYLSGHTPLGKHSITKDTSVKYNSDELASTVKPMAYHGVGGMVLSDNAGHFKTLEVKASYAYHLPIGKHFNLSLGAFLGFKQLSVDNEKFVSDAQGGTDPTLNTEATTSTMNPDVTLGIWGYHKKYYFGISSFQLLGNDVKVSETSESSLNRHYYLTGGYKWDISEKLFLVPSVLVKMLPGVPLTTDINAKLNYNQKFWGGASFRLGNEAESVVLLAGITLKNLVDIGYAYDITLTDMNTVKNNGSHEIIVGLRLVNHQHHAPPKQFW